MRYSEELLIHFSCDCGKWFSVADRPDLLEDINNEITCPSCKTTESVGEMVTNEINEERGTMKIRKAISMVLFYLAIKLLPNNYWLKEKIKMLSIETKLRKSLGIEHPYNE